MTGVVVIRLNGSVYEPTGSFEVTDSQSAHGYSVDLLLYILIPVGVVVVMAVLLLIVVVCH